MRHNKDRMDKMASGMRADMDMTTLEVRPSDGVYMDAMNGDHSAKMMIVKRQITLLSAMAGRVCQFRLFKRADPAKIETAVGDRWVLEIMAPDSAFWEAVRTGKGLGDIEERGTQRRLKRRVVSAAFGEIRLADNRTVPMDANIAADAFENAHIDAKYLNRLGMLSAEDRLMLWARYMANKTFDEIASISGLGETTVRERIQRAINMIRGMSGGSMHC